MTAKVTVPAVDRPLVSVVMVTHGGGELAVDAIGALVANTDPVYELIVIDNASPDGTAELLERSVSGATIVRNETNVGFGIACNQGAAPAKGTYLCFLNPDAFVQAGWLEPLLETFVEDESVGAAAPLFLHRDGRVQEAGSAVDFEAVALAIGDGDDPGSFEHRFRRKVDYGSAACLLVRADLFEQAGGFDPVYSPAYYEDVDLCFKLQARGFSTVFEPRSRVVHLRGGGSQKARTLMIMNREVFAQRWSERLQRRRPLRADPTNPRLCLAARDAEAVDRFLVIDDRVPSCDTQTARLLAEIAHLWPDARVTFLGATAANAERYAGPLLARGIEVAVADERLDRWLEERRYHYSVVLVSRSSTVERFEHHLRRTQAQAARIDNLDAVEQQGFRRTIVEAFARVGVAPPPRARVANRSSPTPD